MRWWLGVVLFVVSLAAGLTVVVATADFLSVGSLLRGFPLEYRLLELVVTAAAAAVVWLCGLAAVRALRPGWDAVLLVGPLVLATLAAQAVAPPRSFDESSAFLSAQPISAGSVWLDLGVIALGVLIGAGLPTYALLRSRRGTRPPDPALPL